jgi:hypothetical protein
MMFLGVLVIVMVCMFGDREMERVPHHWAAPYDVVHDMPPDDPDRMFRFEIDEISWLWHELGMDGVMRTPEGDRCDGPTALALVMHRLSYLRTYHDQSLIFRRSTGALCRIYRSVVFISRHWTGSKLGGAISWRLIYHGSDRLCPNLPLRSANSRFFRTVLGSLTRPSDRDAVPAPVRTSFLA